MKSVEINETDKVISEETFNSFKEMGQTLLELKKEVREKNELIAAYKVNFALITYCVLRFTGTFGLNNKEDTMIRETILNGSESPMSAVMKNITGMMGDAMMAEANPAKKKQMEEKFKFFFYLPWVAKFYEWQKIVKVNLPEDQLRNLPEQVKAELTA